MERRPREVARWGNTTRGDGGAVVLVSGGMDSATAVYEATEWGYEPYFLHVSYGQQTENREYECARALAGEVGPADFLSVETAPCRLSETRV